MPQCHSNGSRIFRGNWMFKPNCEPRGLSPQSLPASQLNLTSNKHRVIQTNIKVFFSYWWFVHFQIFTFSFTHLDRAFLMFSSIYTEACCSRMQMKVSRPQLMHIYICPIHTIETYGRPGPYVLAMRVGWEMLGWNEENPGKMPLERGGDLMVVDAASGEDPQMIHLS